jgi:hypothetical protein
VNDVLALILFLGGMVGSILLAVYLILLPPRLFLRDERWLTEEEFRQAAPAKAWCRHLPMIAALAAFPTYAILFFVVKSTCTNGLALLMGMVPLFFLWIYVPVGVVELTAGVSVLVPVGRAARGVDPQYIVSPRATRAGAFRLSVTAVALTVLLVAAYW